MTPKSSLRTLIEIETVEPSPGKDFDSLRVESEPLIQARFASYLSDESGLGPGRASVLFIPRNERQVALFLKEMNQRKMPVTVSGGRTGIVGGAVPQGDALISMDNMNQITGIKWNEDGRQWSIIAQPGIRLRDLQQKIATKSLGKTGDGPEFLCRAQMRDSRT